MAALNPMLAQLRESPEFRAVMADMLATMPVIPSYAPQKTRDQTENLIEEIKHRSSMLQGWALLYSHLMGSQPK